MRFVCLRAPILHMVLFDTELRQIQSEKDQLLDKRKVDVDNV